MQAHSAGANRALKNVLSSPRLLSGHCLHDHACRETQLCTNAPRSVGACSSRGRRRALSTALTVCLFSKSSSVHSKRALQHSFDDHSKHGLPTTTHLFQESQGGSGTTGLQLSEALVKQSICTEQQTQIYPSIPFELFEPLGTGT